MRAPEINVIALICFPLSRFCTHLLPALAEGVTPALAQAGQSQGATDAAAPGFMYQVPDFHDRNHSSFAEVTGRAEGVGWLQRLVLEHAHFYPMLV